VGFAQILWDSKWTFSLSCYATERLPPGIRLAKLWDSIKTTLKKFLLRESARVRSHLWISATMRVRHGPLLKERVIGPNSAQNFMPKFAKLSCCPDPFRRSSTLLCRASDLGAGPADSRRIRDNIASTSILSRSSRSNRYAFSRRRHWSNTLL
jgi:hypothetical protein